MYCLTAAAGRQANQVGPQDCMCCDYVLLAQVELECDTADMVPCHVCIKISEHMPYQSVAQKLGKHVNKIAVDMHT